MDSFRNFAYSKVASAPAPSPLTGLGLSLEAGGGALMPDVPFNAVVWPEAVLPLASNAEVVRVTQLIGDTAEILRAQEGTTAKEIAKGYQFAAAITAKSLTDIQEGLTTTAALAADLVTAERERAEAAEATVAAAASTAAVAAAAEASRAEAAEALLQPLSGKNVANGYAGLNGSGQIAGSVLPSGIATLTAEDIGAQPPAHHAATHAEDGTDPLTAGDLPASVVTSTPRATGTSAFIRSLQNGINPLTYEGFDPTGATSSTKALEEAVEAAIAQSLPLVLPYQSLIKTNSFSKPGAPVIEGNGSIVELQTAGGLIFGGKLSAKRVALNANSLAGSNILSIPTAEAPAWLTVGARLLVGTTKQINGDTTGRYRGQQVRVAETSTSGSNTLVHLSEALIRGFTTAEEHWVVEGTGGRVEGTEPAYIELVEVGVRPQIGDLEVQNPLALNTRLLVVEFCRDIDIDVKLKGAQQPALEIRSCYGGSVRGQGRDHEWNNTNKFGYNIAATGSTADIDFYAYAIDSNYAFQTTAVNGESGDTTNLRVRGACFNSNTSAWGNHPAGYYTTYYDVVAENCAEGGIGASAQFVTFYNPRVTGTGIGKNWEGLEGKNGYGCWASLNNATSTAIKGFKLIGGIFENINGDAIHVESGNTVDDFTVKGCVFNGIAGIGSINASCPVTNVKQERNTIVNYGTGGVAGSTYAWRYQKASTGYIRGETVDSTGASATVGHYDESSPGLKVAGIKAANVPESGINWQSGTTPHDGPSWVNGTEVVTPYQPTVSGGAVTLEPGNGKLQRVVLTESPVAISLANGVAGAEMIVDLIQDATGGRIVTWPSSVEFPGGTPPIWTEGNRHNRAHLIWDETAKKWVAEPEGIWKEQIRSNNIKPEAAAPAIPAEGAENAAELGVARRRQFALKGNGTKKSWKLEHKLASNAVLVQVYTATESGGKLIGKELRSVQPNKIVIESEQKIELEWTTALSAGEFVLVEVIG